MKETNEQKKTVKDITIKGVQITQVYKMGVRALGKEKFRGRKPVGFTIYTKDGVYVGYVDNVWKEYVLWKC